jgi:hypothetical protein
MSGATTSPAASNLDAKPARNPVERIVVWGLIAAGVVVIGVEARAKLAYNSTEEKLVKAMEVANEAGTSDFTIDKLPELLVGNPSRVEDESPTYHNVVHLKWNGLLKQYGLHVQYGKSSRLITGYTTDNPPPEAPPVAATRSNPADGTDAAEAPEGPIGPEGGEPGGPGGGGGYGGGPRPDPMASDADGDGKLSREEATGRTAENFDEIDTNTDGFVDAAEIEARRAARRGAGGPGGGFGPPGGGGAGGERQRPELETPAVSPAATSPAGTDAPAADKPATETQPATPQATTEAPAATPPATPDPASATPAASEATEK